MSTIAHKINRFFVILQRFEIYNPTSHENSKTE